MLKIPMVREKSQARLNSALLERTQLTKIQKVEGRVTEVGDTDIKEAQQEIAQIWQDNVIKMVKMPIGLKVGRII